MRDINIALEGIYKEDDEVRRAREKAMVYLSYSEHTVKSMYEKLIDQGFEKNAVDEVLAYLLERGYIDERDYLIRFCRHCAEKRGYGRHRIVAMAREKGFSQRTIDENIDEAFEEIDFDDICLSRLEKLGEDKLSEKKSRDKAIASLMRRGFSLSEIKAAIRTLLEQA